MYTDANLRVSDAQDLSGGTDVSDAIDLVALNREVGTGYTLECVITVDTTVTRAAGASNVTFQIVHDTVATLASHVTISQTQQYAKTELVAGRTPIVIKVSPMPASDSDTDFRYLGVRYFIDNAPDAGAVSAHFVVNGQDSHRFYSSGFAVED